MQTPAKEEITTMTVNVAPNCLLTTNQQKKIRFELRVRSICEYVPFAVSLPSHACVCVIVHPDKTDSTQLNVCNEN